MEENTKNEELNLKVDPTTWITDCDAAFVLADKLTKLNDKKLIKKVNTTIEFFYTKLNSLAVLDKKNREFFSDLLYDRTIKSIPISYVDYDPEIRSYMRNVIKTIYRQNRINNE